jgi:LuxR family transcriptional regulator, maltose regulon positive regulatory protein
MNAVTVTTRPRARDFIIKRPRLTKLLDDSTSRLLLLVAPAGYGKTTLAREWTAERRHVGWYAGGPAMADVAALCVGVVEVLAQLHTPPKEDVVERVRILAARGHDPRGLAKAVAGAAPSADALLVIDDYQYIAESEDAEAFVEELVTLTDFRLLLTSRERPGWLAARKVVYGEATVIEMDALAFTDEEARAVLGERKAGREQILAEARGWPAVIGLAAMHGESSGAPQLDRAKRLDDFFAEDLLRKSPRVLRRGLLLLAICGETSRDVARELLGDEAEQLLNEALDRGFLTAGANDDVALHPLLNRFLTKLVGGLPIAEREALVANAICVMSGKERWDDCLIALHAFPIPAVLESVLDQAIESLLDGGRTKTLEDWLSLATKCRASSPMLLLAEAETALRRGDTTKAQALAEQAGDTLIGERAARAFLTAARAAHLRDDADGMTRNSRRSCDLASKDETQVDALWVEYASAVERDAELAAAVIARIEEIGDVRTHNAFRLLLAKGFLLSQIGDIRHAVERLELASGLISRINDPFARTNFLYIFGHVNVLRAHYPDALAVLDTAIDAARESGLDFAVDYALVKRGAALLGLRHLVAAQSVVHELVRRFPATSTHVRDNTGLLEVKLRIATGDSETAATLLEREPDPRRTSFRGELLGYRALLAAARGDHASTEELIRESRSCTGFGEPRALTALARAIVDTQLGKASRTAQTTVELLRAGMRDPVVTAYRLYPSLLEFGERDSSATAVLMDALNSSRDYDLAKRVGLAIPRERRPRSKLTPRECEVLELIAQGRANHEIARALFISHSTAKVHVRHIFEKLGVRTRAEAALFAASNGENHGTRGGSID